MPLYDYECSCGNTFERVLSVKECDRPQKCLKCGAEALKVIRTGHGGIQCDSETDVSWLPSAVQNLPDEAAPHIHSRGDFRRYLKKNGIVERGDTLAL